MVPQEGSLECPIELESSDDGLPQATKASAHTQAGTFRTEKRKHLSHKERQFTNATLGSKGLPSRAAKVPVGKSTTSNEQYLSPRSCRQGSTSSTQLVQPSRPWAVPATEGATIDNVQTEAPTSVGSFAAYPRNSNVSANIDTSITASQAPSTRTGDLPQRSPATPTVINRNAPEHKALLGTEDRAQVTEQELVLAENQIEACLQQHLTNLHKKHAYSVKELLARARKSPEYDTHHCSSPTINHPFRNMQPLGSHGPIKFTKFKSDAPKVPFYNEYERFQQNRLVENNMKQLYIPDIGDNHQQEELNQSMIAEYDMVNTERPFDILHDDQYRFYGGAISAFLKEIGVSWEAMLFCFLAKLKVSRKILGNYKNGSELNSLLRALIQEKENEQIAQDLARKKWTIVLKQLSKPPAPVLWRSITALKLFRLQRNSSLWHFTRRSEIAQKLLESVLPEPKDMPICSEPFSYRKFTCKVCFLWIHNCSCHGEIRESNHEMPARNEDSDSDESYEAGYESSDPDIDKGINYRYTVAGVTRSYQGSSDTARRKFNIKCLRKTGNVTQLDWRKPFYPCSHKGSCKSENCRCYREGILCEKICNCADDCSRRYPGCSCKGPGNLVCSRNDDDCECVKLNRECDADLCKDCGAANVLDPEKLYDNNIAKDQCCNVNVQRGAHKKTWLATSTVHGLGLVTGERFAPGDFVGEYTGELITKNEADRRGLVYHLEVSQYLFKLYHDSEGGNTPAVGNHYSQQEVDATCAGSRTRFINCAPKKANINCVSKLLLCNTVVRIGIFATSDIDIGEEFLIDYGPSFFPQTPESPPVRTYRFNQPEQSEFNHRARTPALVIPSELRLPPLEHRSKFSERNGRKLSAPISGRAQAVQLGAVSFSAGAGTASVSEHIDTAPGSPSTGRIKGTYKEQRTATASSTAKSAPKVVTKPLENDTAAGATQESNAILRSAPGSQIDGNGNKDLAVTTTGQAPPIPRRSLTQGRAQQAHSIPSTPFSTQTESADRRISTVTTLGRQQPPNSAATSPISTTTSNRIQWPNGTPASMPGRTPQVPTKVAQGGLPRLGKKSASAHKGLGTKASGGGLIVAPQITPYVISSDDEEEKEEEDDDDGLDRERGRTLAPAPGRVASPEMRRRSRAAGVRRLHPTLNKSDEERGRTSHRRPGAHQQQQQRGRAQGGTGNNGNDNENENNQRDHSCGRGRSRRRSRSTRVTLGERRSIQTLSKSRVALERKRKRNDDGQDGESGRERGNNHIFR